MPVKRHLSSEIPQAKSRLHLLIASETLPLDGQERKAPELTNVALGGRDGAKRCCLEPVVVILAPDLAAKLCIVGFDKVPEAVVSGYNSIV